MQLFIQFLIFNYVGERGIRNGVTTDFMCRRYDLVH